MSETDEKRPIRLRTSDGTIDLRSLAVASERVSAAAHEVRMATGRTRRAHEDLEAAHAAHRRAVDGLTAARRELDIARHVLDGVERGDVLPAEPDPAAAPAEVTP